MTKRNDDALSATLRAKADLVIPSLDRSGGLNATEILALRSWFDARRQHLKSSGGRPTNPDWTIKRQVPFAPETWNGLKELAATCSAGGQNIGPGQIAGFLVEEAVRLKVMYDVKPDAGVVTAEVESALIETHDPRFRDWRMPELYSGLAA